MEFPVYVKYSNDKHFFKIISETAFEEIVVTGNRHELFVFKAEIYPDKLRIKDMLENASKIWRTITEEEYLSRRAMT